MAARRRPTRKSQHRALIRAHRDIYPELLAFQGGGCAICGRAPNPERRHAMDHDHKKMELRGILCTSCNMRLSDRITSAWLRAAADYLDRTPYSRFKEQA